MKKIILFFLAAITAFMMASCSDEIPVQSQNSSDSQNGTVGSTEGSASKPSGLSGDVWNAIKNKPEVNLNYFLTTSDLTTWGIPLELLKDEGLIYINEDGKWRINGKQASSGYTPFQVRAYIDENTKENDLYLLMQYASGALGQNESNKDVYIATWRIKYVLSDDDYRTFLNLENDFRVKFFIQEMDKQYQPEVLSKSVARHDMLMQGSHVRNEHWTKQGFANIFIDSIDYNNQTIRFGSLQNGTFRYMIVDIRKGAGWKWAQIRKGLTEEECEKNIQIESMSTPVGSCLTKFNVAGYDGGYGADQSKEAFKNTTDIHKVNVIDIESNQKEYYGE